MAKYHINKAGEPRPCKAAYQCPFGSAEDHHDTPDAARDAYEKKMTAQIVPDGASKSSLGLRDLTKLARISSDKEILSNAVDRGSDRTFNALSENQNMTPDLLTKAAEKASSSDTRGRLVAHKNYPVAKMTGDDAAGLYKPHSSWENDRLLASDDLNDEHITGITSRYPDANLSTAIANPNNKVSNDLAVSVNPPRAGMGNLLRGGRITPEQVGETPAKDVYWGDISRETRPEYLDGFASSSIKGAQSEDPKEKDYAQYNATHVAKNENTSPETLHRLTENKLALREVYDNENTAPETRKLATESDPELARRSRLDELDKSIPGGLRATITTDSSTAHPSGRYRGYSVTEVTFDTKKMEELGLDTEDVYTLMDARRSYNAGASFDPATGVFRGAVDSTD